VFEFRDKPSFTIQIPGEFSKRKPTNGDVFNAYKAFNSLSVSVSKLETNAGMIDAARRYVAALKRVGNGNAELIKEVESTLPDGTPVVEVFVKWVTKKNASLTTQALIASDDGYSVTIATHTWEVKLPDKKFFYTLKFD
jgi:hypothetical protein